MQAPPPVAVELIANLSGKRSQKNFTLYQKN